MTYPSSGTRVRAHAAGVGPRAGPARSSRWRLFHEQARALRTGTRWVAPLLVRRYPQTVAVPALGPVGSTDLKVRTTFRLRPQAHGAALQRVQEDRAHTEAELSAVRSEADPRFVRLRQEAEGLRRLEEALVARRTRLWDVLVCCEGRGNGPKQAVEEIAPLRESLVHQGFRFHTTSYRAREALRAARLGGAVSPDLFHALPEEGVAALLPLWEDRLEEPRGALVGLHAHHGTPLFMDRFRHPSHSSAIFGETGSGKSYASALGWMRARWFHPDLSVFVLDPLGGLAEVVRSLGGQVVRVGDGALALNPLDPATTGGDLRLKATQVGVMFRALFPSLSDEEVALLDTTLSKLYAERARDPGSPKLRAPEARGGGCGFEAPRLSELFERIGSAEPRPQRLLTLLERATQGSLRGLDRPTNLDLTSPWLGFDLSAVSSEELPFFLTLLLDLIYGEMRRRGGPKLVVLDEAHYLTRFPSTAQFLDHLVRHARHFESGVELLSQDPSDFLREEGGRAVLNNLDSVLLLRLKDGGEAVAPLLGLDDGEMAFLRRAALPARSGYSEGLLRLRELHLPLAVVSSTEEDRLLREAFARERAGAMRGAQGTDP